LTRELLGRGLRVIAIEKDRRLAEQLGARYAVGGEREVLTVVAGDALKIDWHGLPAHKVVGNIPYYITSPLIDKALSPPLPERVVFLLQEEVADRLVAKLGSRAYGALSVGVQAVAHVEKLFTVAPGAFRPPPKVRSALVRLTPLTQALVRLEEIAPLRAFVTACFSKRRKQLKNAVPGLSAEELEGLGFDPAIRPEGLAPEAFVRLFRHRQSVEQ
jgi:16S rRNA (adenine1518-N6/adenine1519-N6)-dimethyltransferase